MRALTILVASALAIVAAVAAVRGRALGGIDSASALPAVPAPADPTAVASVHIVGPGLPVAALERVLSTRVGAPLREDDLVRDRAALTATLEARGHLGAAVTDVRIAWSNGAHVVFEVAAGGMYLVDHIRVEGAPTRRFADLATVPTLLAGQAWQPKRTADNVALLRDWLVQRGVRADVTARRSIDHVRHTVDVTFEIVAR